MPKECTHWILARRIAAAYPGPRVAAVLARWEPLYLLGSVLPDTPFYSPSGRVGSAMRAVSARLHGNTAGSPLGFLAVVAGLSPHPRLEPLEALALGVAGHILADSQFHPIVYYFCGIDDLHPGALRRHFAFETRLDAHMMAIERPPWGGRLHAILRAARRCLSDLDEAVRRLLFASQPQVSARAVRVGLWRHAAAQRMFYSPALRHVLAALERVRPQAAGALPALLYPARFRRDPFFEGRIAYRHPVTGEPRNDTLVDAEQRTMRLAHAAFDLLESRDARPIEAARAARCLLRLAAKAGLPMLDRPAGEIMRYFDIR